MDYRTLTTITVTSSRTAADAQKAARSRVIALTTSVADFAGCLMKPSDEPVVPDFFASGVLGLGHAVAVQHEHVAGLHPLMARFVDAVVEQAHHRAAGLQPLHGAAGDEKRRIVPGIAVREVAVRTELPVERRHEA